jgi:type I restriction enzyme, S subunit
MRLGYKHTEAGVVPKEWDVRSLSAFTTMVASGKSRHSKVSGAYPVHGSTGIIGYTDLPDYEGDAILVARVGANAGRLNVVAGQYGVTDNTIMLRVGNAALLSYIWRSLDARRLNSLVFGSGQPLITGSQLKALQIAVPPIPEQRAIAAALTDVDALLTGLDRLIAKKRDLKQAAMQQLLTGQTRLPGFYGKWEVMPFAAVLVRLNAKAHQIQASDYRTTGRFPVVDQGKESVVGFSDKQECFRCPIDGVIVFGDHTCFVKFIDFDFLVGADGTQVLQGKTGQSTRFHAFQLQYRGVEPTGYNRHFKFVKERVFIVPSLAEQIAIATVLSDMDAELSALEARRTKTHALKQAMMQELLTGKTRLV